MGVLIVMSKKKGPAGSYKPPPHPPFLPNLNKKQLLPQLASKLVQKRAPPPPPPPAKRPPPKNKKIEEKAKENKAMTSKSRGSTAGEGENLPGLDKKELEKIANQYVKNKDSFDVDIPHLLYIQKGQELRASISKDLFDAFIKSLHAKVMKLDPKEASKISILWTEYTEGRGLVACEDEATEKCVRALAGDFKHNGLRVRWNGKQAHKKIIYLETPI